MLVRKTTPWNGSTPLPQRGHGRRQWRLQVEHTRSGLFSTGYIYTDFHIGVFCAQKHKGVSGMRPSSRMFQIRERKTRGPRVLRAGKRRKASRRGSTARRSMQEENL